MQVDHTLFEKYMAKFIVPEPNTGCWLWTAALSDGGYGTASFGPKGTKRIRIVHRVTYTLFVGPIPQGLHLDHLCRVRSCCNPRHLEPVTQAENNRRGDAGKYNLIKTTCPLGHPYNEGNTAIVFQSGKYTKRICVTCRRENERRVYWAKKGISNPPERRPEWNRLHASSCLYSHA